MCDRSTDRDDDGEDATEDAEAVTEPQRQTESHGLGALQGQIYIAEDFDELPDDIAEAFGLNEDVGSDD